jgi:hypothetical protein
MNASLFSGKKYSQEKTNDFKFLALKILLFSTLITVPLIESNSLKYLDPGSGSMIFQTIFGLSQCAICGIPVAIIGAVIYFFRKKKKNDSQSDSTKESD